MTEFAWCWVPNARPAPCYRKRLTILLTKFAEGLVVASPAPAIATQPRLCRRAPVVRLAIAEARKFLDVGADFLLSKPQFVELLQIQPKFGAGAKPMAKTKRRIGRN